MTYEMYRNVFTICAAAAGAMAFVSILLFILFKIPSVIGDLTGITAKRGIERIRSGNPQTVSSKRRKKQKHQGYKMNTERLQAAAKEEKGETEKLRTAGNETTLLSQTTLLHAPAVNETTILQPEFGVLEEITILHTEEEI